MKLKIGDRVYLQKYDVDFIVRELSAPPALMREIDECASGVGRGDTYHFGYTFKDPVNVNWIMSRDWLIDYEEGLKKPISELEELCASLDSKLGSMFAEFDEHDKRYQDANFNRKREQLYKLNHKVRSLSSLISARYGDLVFFFPSGYYNYPRRDSYQNTRNTRKQSNDSHVQKRNPPKKRYAYRA